MDLKKIVEIIKNAQVAEDVGPKAQISAPDEDPGPARRGNKLNVQPSTKSQPNTTNVVNFNDLPKAPRTTDVPVNQTANKPVVNMGDNSIKVMQREMSKLAEIIFKQIGLASKKQRDEADRLRQEAKQLRGVISDEKIIQPQLDQQAVSRNSFSDFTIHQIADKSDIKGKEFDINPDAKKMGDKSPTNLTRMHAVLDSLRRIGSGKTEFAADGIWKERTNNGLLNIIAITHSIIEVSKELGFTLKSYNDAELNTLKELVPQDEKGLSILEKLQNAPKITKNLKEIQVMFNEYNENVLNSPYNKGAIEGAPLATYNKKDKDNVIFNENEKQTLLSLVQNKSDVLKDPSTTFYIYLGEGTQFPVTAADLLNQKALDAWSSKQPLTREWRKDPEHWKVVVEQVIKQVREQANKKLAVVGPPAPQAPQQRVPQAPKGR